MQFKIATYNLWKDEGDFPHRIEKIASLLREIDIICLQEDYCSEEFSSSERINQSLDYFKVSTQTRKKLRKGVPSSSNITLLSRFPVKLLEQRLFNPGTSEERAVQLVEISVDGYRLLLGHGHLCHVSARARREQIDYLIQSQLPDNQNAQADIRLICGDLNAPPHSDEIRHLAHKYTSKNQMATYVDGNILDYIFYQSKLNLMVNVQLIHCGLSDHNCLIYHMTRV